MRPTSSGPQPHPRRPQAFRSGDDTGSSPASVIVLLVIVIMIAELIVMGGRLAGAKADVSNAARQAARTASLSAGPSTAPTHASNAGLGSLQAKGRQCTVPSVDLDTTAFVPGGSVTATVTCTVDLQDLSFLSLPWPTFVISSDAREVIETYRVVL